MTHDFREDYKALALDSGANWEAAHASYRRQVNIWHPDRFVSRPRERLHAEQRFIQLTRSYDSLRTFHRVNQRLPFQRTGDVNAAPGDDGASAHRPEPNPAEGREQPLSECEMRNAGILSAKRPRERTHPVAWLRRLRWPLLACALAAATFGTMFVLDRNERLAKMEEGRALLRDSLPSEFMPSQLEANQQSTRGVFIERQDGRLGDQLMPDIFR